ncbi:hypothetical protein OA79_09510 [Marinomonas sp. TW1]|nr:hypothetical protein OA79_09510 [Marinomonas sp. TW1]
MRFGLTGTLLNVKRNNEPLNPCQFDAILIARPYGLPKSVTDNQLPAISAIQYLTVQNAI